MSRAGRISVCLGMALGATAIACNASSSMGSLAPRSPAGAGAAQQEWVTDPRANCRALDPNFDPSDSIQWQGSCVAGMINGLGTLSYINDGHVLETITGSFAGGALLPGKVSAIWSDGSKYNGGQSGGQFDGSGSFVSATGDKIDGEWKAGALNGTATVIWANGDRYDGEWKDGSPVRQNAAAGQSPAHDASSPTAIAASLASAAHAGGGSEPAPMAQIILAAAAPQDAPVQASGAALPLHDFVGKTLTAVDGSTIDLSQNEGGLMRVVTLPNGVTQQTSFAFMSDRIGTVSNETAAIGLFRANGDELDTNYIDGKTEVMKPGAAGGLLLTSRNPDGNSLCTAWYPEGHVYSQDEKKAAVQEYASRLGIGESPSPRKHHAVRASGQICGGGFVTSIAATGLAPSAALSPQPVSQQSSSFTGRPASGNGSATEGLQNIPVKDSTVHLIDAPYDPSTTPKALQNVDFGGNAITPQASPPTLPYPAERSMTDASQCLSVTTDGEYWGFQNRCGKAVQFAYCEMSDANPLTSCHHTSVSGSVAANGFSALVNDTSLSQQGVKHEFRWMACDGGAGEVVPHLDSVDPPSGRCLRAVPAGIGTNPPPAGS